MPNAGLPQRVDRQFVYAAEPAYFGDAVARFLDAGARIVGGCCGTTPEHIRHMRQALDAITIGGRPRTGPTVGPRAHDRARARRSPIASAVARATEPPPPTRLASLLGDKGFIVSVEIDPPRSVRIERTIEAARLLQDAGVDIVNISDSAMARVRMGAMAVAFGVQHDLDLECLVHVTTRDRNLMALESELLGAHALGVRNILALTGDPPRIGDYPTGTGIWDVDSIGLIGILSRLNRGEDQAGKPIGAPAGFTIACALDPTAADTDQEIERLAAKLEAGADLIMTQPIYAREQWDRFMDRAVAALAVRPAEAGAARRPAAAHPPPRRVPAQRGARHHDPRRSPRGDACRRRAGRRGRARDGPRAARAARDGCPGHLRDAQLRPLRAGRRAGPARQGGHAHGDHASSVGADTIRS